MFDIGLWATCASLAARISSSLVVEVGRNSEHGPSIDAAEVVKVAHDRTYS
ncbi:MAG: hypothetical protein M9905_04220 [Rhizobiaceae bacterium]|nr:hypothetical protein [Rhizobiaceae bacterium]